MVGEANVSNYYDDVLAQILGSGMFGPNQDASARAMASDLESERFRGLTKRKRKLGKKEHMPKGAYALAMYPGLQSAVEWAATGNLPGGSASVGMWMKEGADMKLREENSRKRREWAAMQRALLGGW